MGCNRSVIGGGHLCSMGNFLTGACFSSVQVQILSSGSESSLSMDESSWYSSWASSVGLGAGFEADSDVVGIGDRMSGL